MPLMFNSMLENRAFQLDLQCFYILSMGVSSQNTADWLAVVALFWLRHQSPIVVNGRVETNTADWLAISFPRVSQKHAVQIGYVVPVIYSQSIMLPAGHWARERRLRQSQDFYQGARSVFTFFFHLIGNQIIQNKIPINEKMMNIGSHYRPGR